MKTRMSVGVAAVAAALVACRSPELVADGPVAVMREPYPSGYPAITNSVVATLHHGERLKVKTEGYGKDFKYYQVALPSGGSGYIIYGDGPFHIEK